MGVAAIFTYLLPDATETFQSCDCPYITLSNYDALIEVALTNNDIKQEDLEKLKAWKQDPRDESWIQK